MNPSMMLISVTFPPQLTLSLLPPGNQLQFHPMQVTPFPHFRLCNGVLRFPSPSCYSYHLPRTKAEDQECFLSLVWDGPDYLAQGLDYRARCQCAI